MNKFYQHCYHVSSNIIVPNCISSINTRSLANLLNSFTQFNFYTLESDGNCKRLKRQCRLDDENVAVLLETGLYDNIQQGDDDYDDKCKSVVIIGVSIARQFEFDMATYLLRSLNFQLII